MATGEYGDANYRNKGAERDQDYLLSTFVSRGGKQKDFPHV